MTYHIYVDKSGALELFTGRDEKLLEQGSFVLESGGSQAVAKLADGYWDVWLRIPNDSSEPLGVARPGKRIGEVHMKEGFPHIWEAYQWADDGSGVATVPSPYGSGSIGAAVLELLRLR
ncbi:hypothetical protein FIV50_01120 [Microbacterium foliorum]|uniref:Uncharacterized protein n=1 Tax=Microbacterium foliorum TaxID=104336 RepID=A0A4Y5YLV0_9MICO|nr:hypothetical protein [Microbacterium foliorum]QDE33525.1 hypothetical protein FIV50_01120 [Microbacterium foliorum]